MGKKSKGQQDDPATSPGGGKSTSPKKPGRSKRGKGKKSQATADNTLEIEAAVGHIGHSTSPDEGAWRARIAIDRARVKNFERRRLTMKLWRKWVDQDRDTNLGRAHHRWCIRQHKWRVCAMVITAMFSGKDLFAKYGPPILAAPLFVAVDAHFSSMYEREKTRKDIIEREVKRKADLMKFVAGSAYDRLMHSRLTRLVLGGWCILSIRAAKRAKERKLEKKEFLKNWKTRLPDGVRQNMMLWGSGASLGIDPTMSPSGSRVELPSGRELCQTGALINRHSSIRGGGRMLPAVSKGRKSRRCVSRGVTPGSTEVAEPVAPSLFGSATSVSRPTSIVERYKHWTQHNGDTDTASTPAARIRRPSAQIFTREQKCSTSHGSRSAKVETYSKLETKNPYISDLDSEKCQPSTQTITRKQRCSTSHGSRSTKVKKKNPYKLKLFEGTVQRQIKGSLVQTSTGPAPRPNITNNGIDI